MKTITLIVVLLAILLTGCSTRQGCHWYWSKSNCDLYLTYKAYLERTGTLPALPAYPPSSTNPVQGAFQGLANWSNQQPPPQNYNWNTTTYTPGGTVSTYGYGQGNNWNSMTFAPDGVYSTYGYGFGNTWNSMTFTPSGQVYSTYGFDW